MLMRRYDYHVEMRKSLGISFLTMLLAMFTIIGCSHKDSHDYAGMLQELQMTNITKKVEESIRSTDFRAVALQGQSTVVPGLPNWKQGMSDEVMDFRDKYGLKYLAGTGDSIESSVHGEYIKVAAEYAERYNIELLKRMREMGMY